MKFRIERSITIQLTDCIKVLRLRVRDGQRKLGEARGTLQFGNGVKSGSGGGRENRVGGGGGTCCTFLKLGDLESGGRENRVGGGGGTCCTLLKLERFREWG